jgi:hypothetical protein
VLLSVEYGWYMPLARSPPLSRRPDARQQQLARVRAYLVELDRTAADGGPRPSGAAGIAFDEATVVTADGIVRHLSLLWLASSGQYKSVLKSPDLWSLLRDIVGPLGTNTFSGLAICVPERAHSDKIPVPVRPNERQWNDALSFPRLGVLQMF